MFIKESITVKANVEIVLELQLKDNYFEPNALVMFEPIINLNSEVLFARSVDNVHNGTIKATLINLSDKPQKMELNQLVGQVHMVEIVEPIKSDASKEASSSEKAVDENTTLNEETTVFKSLNLKTLKKIASANEINYGKLSPNQIKIINNLSSNVKCNMANIRNDNSKVEAELDHLIHNKIKQLKFGSQLKNMEFKRLQELIFKHRDVFSWHEYDVGQTNVTEHHIDTVDAKPIKQKPYKCAYAMKTEIERQIELMLKNGIIKESNSPWASPVVMVKKTKMERTGFAWTIESLTQ